FIPNGNCAPLNCGSCPAGQYCSSIDQNHCLAVGIPATPGGTSIGLGMLLSVIGLAIAGMKHRKKEA
ncbi:MAG: hypothetical protein WBY94_20035, partial [Polyangiaceae bacterium]